VKLRLSRWDPEGTQRVRAENAVKALGSEAVRKQSLELTFNYLFAPMVQGGPMTNDEKAQKFWDEKVVPAGKAADALAGECKRLGRKTLAYENALKDSAKLKAEYETIKGGGTYDPTNLQHVETAANKTARHYLGLDRGQ